MTTPKVIIPKPELNLSTPIIDYLYNKGVVHIWLSKSRKELNIYEILSYEEEQQGYLGRNPVSLTLNKENVVSLIEELLEIAKVMEEN